jgi:ubiquinone/menaquinone biosynthesis C-methylase UbiE
MTTQALNPSSSGGHRICPWWLAYFFDNPLRRMIHPPDRILGPHINKGMTVLDFGCGFGHFALGMARLTGGSGQVIAADVQQKMLDKTLARARKAGLDTIIHPRLCDGNGIGPLPPLDFALICNALHETPDPAAVLFELFGLLKPAGRFLLMEPAAHLKTRDFDAEVAMACKAGFEISDHPAITRELCVLFQKPEPQAKA